VAAHFLHPIARSLASTIAGSSPVLSAVINGCNSLRIRANRSSASPARAIRRSSRDRRRTRRAWVSWGIVIKLDIDDFLPSKHTRAIIHPDDRRDGIYHALISFLKMFGHWTMAESSDDIDSASLASIKISRPNLVWSPAAGTIGHKFLDAHTILFDL